MNIEEEEEFSGDTGIDLKEDEESWAFLIGAYKGAGNLKICEEHLDELENLAETFGVPTLEKIPCPIRKIEASTFLPSGKLEEIAHLLQEKKANLVIFDEEISPAQQRNLEKALKVAVMDRTELILEIFAQRAQTKEARLQIELARTKYEFPRLKRLWSHFSRQRARGGYLKGEGEKQIEIDRRLLKRRLERLSQELKEVKRYRETQSAARRRSGIPAFAIVGYTNAGKSTLLNALTQADVLVEDKLFATLDPTTRKFTLPNNQEVLLTDTVGFIRKLPHTLVAAFRSTLEAALHDDVLLHLIDASHPLAEEHAETTRALLKELDAQEESIITVLNKVDLCKDRQMIDRLRIRFPKTVTISATHAIGFDELAQMMMRELQEKRKIVKLKIPQSEYALVATLRREGNILYEEYEENDILLRAEVPIILLHRFDEYLDENQTASP
ncbi:MAG: GTPase HflX [Chlamydiales bacterium]|nr:GTPase HflX [Chlamydiales bacterium]